MGWFSFFQKKKFMGGFWCDPWINLRRKKCLSLQRLIVTVSKTIEVIKFLPKYILVMIIVTQFMADDLGLLLDRTSI